ncbi:MAG TPA: PKD domain-containing protein [Solirubrobacterales bacterium]|nr:PKD domain-containing protein [Solirubrobacterales bacterium]
MLQPQLHHRLSRVLAALALAGACLLVGVAGARADDAQFAIVSPGGEQQTLSLAALAGNEDVIDRTYALRSADGESSAAVSGFSLTVLLTSAGIDPYGFSYLEVQRPAGGSVLLSRHQALNAGAFDEGPPVIYAAPGGTGFLRPSTGASDLNASDSFEAPQGITVVLRSDSPLRVRAQASPLRTRPGESVAFEAIVDRAGAGEQLEYSWYFDDGDSASGATARHSFAKRGSYDVVVGVTTPGDRAGTSAVVTIQVGAPLSGPDRKGGGRRREAAAPDHGAANGTRGAVPPGPGGGRGHLGRTPSDTRPAAALSVRRGTPEMAQHKAEPGPEAGETVVGELVRAVMPVDAVKPDAPGARAGQLSAGGGGGGLPGVAIGLLVTVGLLGFGALVEIRSLQP